MDILIWVLYSSSPFLRLVNCILFLCIKTYTRFYIILVTLPVYNLNEKYITYKTWDWMNFLCFLVVIFETDFEYLLNYLVGKLSYLCSSRIFTVCFLRISWMYIKCSGKLACRVALWCLDTLDFGKGWRNF